ncbi:MAG: class I SAM-dependent methyltransferase [Thaumarchaeota archaeon]|nr:class I SAM-dependent methyltransferase [Nitrososphaerota archaeon]
MKLSSDGRVSESQKEMELKMLPSFSDWHDVNAFYYDWWRRGETLSQVVGMVKGGARVLDAGSAPGFTSIGLSMLGYEVVSLDINPEPYRKILEEQKIEVVKANLEDEKIPLPDQSFACVVFTEVIEHLHPYRTNFFMSEINRVLSKGGLLYLTTPNLASLSRRFRLLFGKEPTPVFHTKEHTLKWVCSILSENGFEVLTRGYSTAYNVLTFGARNADLKLGLIRGFYKYPNVANAFRIATYPIVYAVPQLRGTLTVAARKAEYVSPDNRPEEEET